MSAHSYRALFYEQLNDKSNTLYKRRENIIFSYLDPRRLEICIDREDNERVRLKIKPDSLQVELVKLFQLHGLEFKKQPTKDTKLAELTPELVEIFIDNEKKKVWFDWYCKIFCEEARKKKSNGSWGNWKSKTDLAKVFVSLDDLPLNFVKVLKNEKLLNDEGKLALLNVTSTKLFPGIQDFCEWLDGIWLEHYVLEQVKNIPNNQCIQHYGMDFNILLTSTEDFQFDVAFTRGYQLFAISCTTSSDRGLCKSKLFEAYLRAQQMGGDEAIDRQQTFQSIIICSNETDANFLMRLLEKSKDIWLGGSRTAGYGHIKISNVNLLNNWNEVYISPNNRIERDFFTVTLLSDLILRDEWGQHSIIPPSACSKTPVPLTQEIETILGMDTKL